MKFANSTIPPLLALALACSPALAAHQVSGRKAAKAKTEATHASRVPAKTGTTSKREASGKKERKMSAGSAKVAHAAAVPATVALSRIEQQVLELPTAKRARALTMMLMMSSLATSMLMEDDATTGRQAANYGSGVALERLQAVLVKAKLPAAAGCAGKFAAVQKDPSRNLALSFPEGCSGLKELQNIDTGPTTPKLEDLAIRWATGAVQQGLVQARQAGFTFKPRPKPVGLDDIYKE
jgi:hypothetical protein